MTDHWTFVALAYGVAFVVVGVITARIMLDYRRVRAELARLESEGAAIEGDGQ